MREQAWELRTLLPDLPGESEVASCRLPGPSGSEVHRSVRQVVSPLPLLFHHAIAHSRFSIQLSGLEVYTEPK